MVCDLRQHPRGTLSRDLYYTRYVTPTASWNYLQRWLDECKSLLGAECGWVPTCGAVIVSFIFTSVIELVADLFIVVVRYHWAMQQDFRAHLQRIKERLDRARSVLHTLTPQSLGAYAVPDVVVNPDYMRHPLPNKNDV